ncbi:MAG: hydroxyacid dehydrogenase [Spirochaetaceae bacterium]|jgi:D-3-phosphoglycerate dehydrogenase|nr:hydroxyacid dehydrogenase [Spirochaetaceae bacterium]
MYHVLIPEDITPPGKDYLLERGYKLKVGVSTDIATLRREIADADALLVRIARYPREVLEAGTKLKVVARHGAGVDNVAVDYAESQGIWVVNAPQANGNTVAEFVTAMVMALECDILGLDRHTRIGDWNYRMGLRRRELAGRTAGILGFGRIGRLTAEKLIRGLGINVMAYHPRRPSGMAGEVRLTQDLGELLGSSDYVIVLVPSTAETRNMFNYQVFSMMKRGAYYINCARGDTYVEADLVKALEEGLIAGAAIDVFTPEPKPESPLFSMDQVIVSQHCAGLSKEAADRMSLHAAMGIDEVLRGDIPVWAANHPANPRMPQRNPSGKDPGCG